MPTIGSFGTANVIVQAVALTANGFIADHVPFWNRYGAMSDALSLHG
jgi:hypothetical protein